VSMCTDAIKEAKSKVQQDLGELEDTGLFSERRNYPGSVYFMLNGNLSYFLRYHSMSREKKWFCSWKVESISFEEVYSDCDSDTREIMLYNFDILV
jgi:hypothetical protein